MAPSSIIVAFATLLYTAVAQRDPGTLGATITSLAAYSALPKCINQCLWDQGSNDLYRYGGDLAEILSCGAPYPNVCYCRGQSASSAYSFIRSCATLLCTTPKASDVNNAVVVYTNYCSTALGAAYTPAVAPQSIEEGENPTISPAPSSATSRATSSVPRETGRPNPTNASTNPSSTVNAANNNGNNNSAPKDDDKIGGISKAAFIGIVISCGCSVLGLAFGIWFKFYKHKKQRKFQQQQLATHGYYQTKT